MSEAAQKEKAANDILAYIKTNPETSTEQISKELKLDHAVVVGACKSFEIKEIIKLTVYSVEQIVMTDLGKSVLEKGAPDIQLLKELKAKSPQKKTELQEKLTKPICDKGFSLAMKSKGIAYDKANDMVTLKTDKIPEKDEVKEMLEKMAADPNPKSYDDKIKKEFVKNQKYIKVETVKYFKIEKGENFDSAGEKMETELTSELLADGKWEKTKFKKYNYNALGKEVNNGGLHRILNVREQMRQIFLEQGFEEMPTNNWVESSFWNFDTLFQPQQHPSRDQHDTFFLENPARSHIQKILPDYFERVKKVHEEGGYGSIGWKYKWNPDEAEKNILRTHTTAVSSRMLFLLAEDMKKTGVFKPKKYFSIDRVFRNESLDNTHLAEFHQIEGLIADKNLGLGHLIGTIKAFFKRLGLTKLRFKPAYNPYTEPSMEMYAYHEIFKSWVEIGNSGIFRPEMLRPMGFPEDVSVIAWGLSLERPTMIHYHIENIRDLFGHEVNIKSTQDTSIYVLND
ncbi:MAG: phenylalanine--tRNA ligase subunit alpha [archaeon]|nr:phenylalanine--tRNA ligase subunit alpha [archaeon]